MEAIGPVDAAVGSFDAAERACCMVGSLQEVGKRKEESLERRMVTAQRIAFCPRKQAFFLDRDPGIMRYAYPRRPCETIK